VVPPLKEMLASASGLLLAASITLPLTVFCANDVIDSIVSINRKICFILK
jgi:hypothetical protein